MLFGHTDANQPAASTDAAQYVAPQTPAPAAAPAAGADPAQQVPAANPLAIDPQTGASLPATTGDSPHDTEETTSVLDQPSAPGYSTSSPLDNDPAPASPFGSPQPAADPAPVTDTATGAPIAHLTPAFSDESAAVQQTPDPAPAPESMAPAGDAAPQDTDSYQTFSDYNAQDAAQAQVPAADSDELLRIKQQALADLAPLVGDLEQSPEDKFRTTMMLVQTTDNASLLKDAYAAAQAITDEKTRAQALLDVVNEVNYFTQPHDQQPPQENPATM